LLRRCAGCDVPHRQQRRDSTSCSSKVRSRLP
jgi:hypothetical protein